MIDPTFAAMAAAFLASLGGNTAAKTLEYLGEAAASRCLTAFRRLFDRAPEDGRPVTEVEQEAAVEGVQALLEQDEVLRRTLTRAITALADRFEPTHPEATLSSAMPATGPTFNFSGRFDAQTIVQGQIHINQLFAGGGSRDAKAEAMVAILRLVNAQTQLAQESARTVLRDSPGEAQAHYVLGVAPLLVRIRGLDGAKADACEKHLAAAAEAGLAAVCAKPRAALRLDHYRARGCEPRPDLRALITLHAQREKEAEAWPYGEINKRLIVSEDFRRIWGS